MYVTTNVFHPTLGRVRVRGAERAALRVRIGMVRISPSMRKIYIHAQPMVPHAQPMFPHAQPMIPMRNPCPPMRNTKHNFLWILWLRKG